MAQKGALTAARLAVSFLLLSTFTPALFAAEAAVAASTAHREVAVELDPYYTNVGLYLPLTVQGIPDMDTASELDIYRHLFVESFHPRFLLLEASINPLPLTGVYLRQQHPDHYDNSLLGGVNMVEAVTAGFEEPAALSLFLGNVVAYRGEEALAGHATRDTWDIC